MSDPILDSVRREAETYGSIPFWSWNDKLDPDELRRQIANMQSIGMHGFFMHARGGLETEYLSDEWFDCIRACVDEAKKRGMEAWSYDENGWPSGFAGGKLLTDPDHLARYLTGTAESEFPHDADVLGVYTIEGGACRPASPADPAPYYTVREKTDDSYVDVLRADITAKFIEATHAEYERRIGEDFGGAMPGFFTDEPQYYRYAPPYSLSLPAEFKSRFGYPLDSVLPAVFWDFEGAEAYRYDYHLIIHELFMNHFIRPIYEWCGAHGCRLTGHAVEEASLSGQMWSAGGVMPFYQYEHIPGIDYLGRGMQTDMSSRQLGSACAQLGRTKALSETFACCGWDVSPQELKRIAEMQYAGGVNLMCQHLYPYGERGQRKRDYPAHYSAHNPWQSYMKTFDTHFANLGRLLAEGGEVVTTLVIHPIRGAYSDYKRGEDRRSIAQLEKDTGDLLALLARTQIPYHFGDEGMMESLASVEGDRIRVGKCVYDFVIVPKMRTLTKNTVRLLRELTENGGKICFIGDIPGEIDGRRADTSALRATVSFDEIRAASPVVTTIAGADIPNLRQRIRVSGGRRLIFTANITAQDVFGARMNVKNCAGAVGVDILTLAEYPLAGEKLPDGSLSLALDLAQSASCVILEKPEAAMLPIGAPRVRAAAIRLPEEWTLTKRPENVVTLDRVRCSTDGGKTWSEVQPLERVRDNLLYSRFAGDLLLAYPFTVNEIPAAASVVWENPSISRVMVNGCEITSDGFLAPERAFSRADAAKYLRKGENELVLALRYYQRDEVYDVLYGGKMESMRNCLCFDTEIENAYLLGDFRVETDPAAFTAPNPTVLEYAGSFAVGAPRDTVRVHNVVADGLPFYGGEICAKAVLTWKPGEPTVFRPDGRFAACAVTVNGQSAPVVFFEDETDLAPYLRAGENEIEVRFVNALRNTAGPFHRGNPEPTGVSPRTFSYEKEWNGGDSCADYRARYAFVRFGI